MYVWEPLIWSYIHLKLFLQSLIWRAKVMGHWQKALTIGVPWMCGCWSSWFWCGHACGLCGGRTSLDSRTELGERSHNGFIVYYSHLEISDSWMVALCFSFNFARGLQVTYLLCMSTPSCLPIPDHAPPSWPLGSSLRVGKGLWPSTYSAGIQPFLDYTSHSSPHCLSLPFLLPWRGAVPKSSSPWAPRTVRAGLWPSSTTPADGRPPKSRLPVDKQSSIAPPKRLFFISNGVGPCPLKGRPALRIQNCKCHFQDACGGAPCPRHGSLCHKGCAGGPVPFFLAATHLMSVRREICPLTRDSDAVVSSPSSSATGHSSSWVHGAQSYLKNITFMNSIMKMKAVTTKITIPNIHIFCFIVCHAARTFISVFTTLADMYYFPVLEERK